MRYKTITITPPTADLSGQLVRIKITADTDMGAVCAATGYDVYFTNASGTTLLPFSRLEWSITEGAATGEFDVLCDIPVSGLTIRIYYGGEPFTDHQNRGVTYAGYLAVYPLNEIPTTILQDISGNGKNAPARTDKTWSQYDHTTFGKLLTIPAAWGVHPTVNLTYAGAITVSAIGDGTSELPMLPSFFDRVSFAGRFVIDSVNAKTYFHLSNTTKITLNGKSGYFSCTVPYGGTEADCVLRVNNQKGTGSASTNFTRYSWFSMFGAWASCTGNHGARDVRVKKGGITDAAAAWEYANLATPSNTLSFGIEKKSKRRRRNQIMEAF